MAIVILAEIPTGSFADNKGRHRSLTLSCILLSISALVYFFSNSFLVFIIAEIVAALGHTFSSGAIDAWLVDSLKARKDEHLQAKVFRLAPSFTTVGVICGVLMGSYLGEFDLAWPWLASSILMFIVACLSLFITENYRATNQFSNNSNLGQEFKLACQQSVNNKDIIFIMCFSACLALIVQTLNMQWSLLFKDEFSFSSSHLGLLFAALAICQAIGAKFSKVMQHHFSEKIAIIIPQIMTAIAIIICSQSQTTVMITTFFLLHEFGRGVFKPQQQHFINERLSSGNRATVLSLDSMFTKLGALFGLLISGFMAEQTSIRTTWLISGFTLLFALLIFLNINRVQKVRQ